jgi:hypothetical protein
MYSSNKDYEKYKHFTIETRWDKFLNFYFDMGKCPEGMTLDRKNNNEGYSKENCRWATPLQQARNRRSTKLSMDNIAEIKSLLKNTPNYIIAKQYCVSQQLICDIRHGRIAQEVANV